ncbi:ATP-binding protein, partial [Bacteroidota bacterium]
VADKIFIPFFTTKEQGSGIGLSLSRQILRLHHGSIHLESGELETGFIITL